MDDKTFLISKGVDIENSMNLFGDMNTYKDTLGEFILSIKDKLSKLDNYKNARDLLNYSIYAHSLKSDARNFGFVELMNIAYNHEMKSKEGDVLYIYNSFPDLSQAVTNAVSIATEFLNKGNTQQSFTPVSSDQLIYNTKTILVVDDSNIVRNFVKRIFSDSYEVGTAKDGEEALNILKANVNNENIVAILLDLNMPKVDGFAVLDYMKENNLFKKTPVSIISGDSSKETIERAFTYNIVDMLEKPFSEQAVKSIVEKTIYFKEMN